MVGQEDSEDKVSVTWEIEVTQRQLTPLQYHYLSRLRHLVDLRASYKTDAAFEAWLMSAINKAIYATAKSFNMQSGDRIVIPRTP